MEFESNAFEIAPVQTKSASEVETKTAKASNNIEWEREAQLIANRLKNIQNVRNAHLRTVLHLTPLSESVTPETMKQHALSVENKVSQLRNRTNTQNITVIHETVIHIIEEISTWLEKIEYRVYVMRQNSNDGPSEEKIEDHNNLQIELDQISYNINELSNVLGENTKLIDNKERAQMQNCLDILEKQANAISNMTKESATELNSHMDRLNEFNSAIESMRMNIDELKIQFEAIQSDNDTPISTLLETLEDINYKIGLDNIASAIQVARGLTRDFPNYPTSVDVYAIYENARYLENAIALEKNRLWQLKDLSEEYLQTLNQFTQTIIITESLVQSPIMAGSFSELQHEIQKHRKCFVNLSHCRMILQSLEENVDSEFRRKHANLHKSLMDKAAEILEMASERAQRISLAASRWTILEKGLDDEKQWLELAQQRVPDLSEVSCVDHERYINMYKSICADINQHHARVVHLTNLATQLQDSISAPKLQEEANDCLAKLMKLREDLLIYLKRLTMFRDTWTTYETLTDKLEQWILRTEREISQINLSTDLRLEPNECARHFWEIRVHHKVNDNIRKQIGQYLERSIEIIPIRDELLQRQFHQQLEERWENLTKKIELVQNTIVDNLFDQDKSIDEKLEVVRKELDEVEMLTSSIKTVIKNEEELNVYIERMEVFNSRLSIAFNELGRLSLLPSNNPEEIGEIFALAHSISAPIAKEIENAHSLRDVLISLQNGIKKLHQVQQNNETILDFCEARTKQDSNQIELAIDDAENLITEFDIQWQENMRLRQILHSLPLQLKVSVSPIKLERDLSQLQDNHHEQETRCSNIMNLLKKRLALWRRFERQLEIVQKTNNENEFMVDLLKLNGQMDYDRLKRTTEHLEVSLVLFLFLFANAQKTIRRIIQNTKCILYSLLIEIWVVY